MYFNIETLRKQRLIGPHSHPMGVFMELDGRLLTEIVIIVGALLVFFRKQVFPFLVKAHGEQTKADQLQTAYFYESLKEAQEDLADVLRRFQEMKSEDDKFIRDHIVDADGLDPKQLDRIEQKLILVCDFIGMIYKDG